MKEIVYFEFNDWIAGKDFPNDEIFRKWIIDNQFKDNEWCIENKLCVLCGAIDMSMNYCVAAPRTWVEKHCPKLLTDEEYTYKTVRIHCDDKGNEKRTVKEHTKKYSDFICKPDKDGCVYGYNDEWEFPEYKEENFGVTWNESWWGDSDDEDDEN